MNSILVVPAWCRPGSAIEYEGTDNEWHPGVIAFLRPDTVVIELADGTQWEIEPERFCEGGNVRKSTAANVVSVAAFPMQNVTRVGQG